MNWNMLSAVGQILSSVGVLVTLIYLAIQTRQNTASIQASTRQAILDADQKFLFCVLDDPDLILLRYKPELTDADKIRLSAYWISFLRMRENLWFQYQNGVLDEGTWQSYRRSITAMASTRFRTWWKNYAIARRAFDPKFMSLVDEGLASTPPVERPFFVEAFD
jgi:hypothetical protein